MGSEVSFSGKTTDASPQPLTAQCAWLPHGGPWEPGRAAQATAPHGPLHGSHGAARLQVEAANSSSSAVVKNGSRENPSRKPLA